MPLEFTYDQQEQIRNKLKGMQKDDIINFIRSRGVMTKKALHESTLFQTQDSENSSQFVGAFDHMLNEKKEQVHNIENGVSVFDKIEHECS